MDCSCQDQYLVIKGQFTKYLRKYNMYIKKVKLPINLSEEEISLLRGKYEYVLHDLKTLALQNVFISYTGLCLTEKGLIKECHHDYPGSHEVFLREVLAYYQIARDNQKQLITIDNSKTYLLIHHPWHNNYYHWMCEAIPRLLKVKNSLKDMILLLPEHFKKRDYVVSSLAPFIFKDIYYIPASKSLLIRNVCVPQIKPEVNSYSSKTLGEIKNLYLSYLKNSNLKDINYGEKIYLSRKKASVRKVDNEDDVEELVRKHGFEVITNEDFNFFELLSIYSKAKCLISIHGAGLTNIIWMKKGSFVFELHRKITSSNDTHNRIFWYLADSLNHKYLRQACEPVDSKTDYVSANLNVNIRKFRSNLELITKSTV